MFYNQNINKKYYVFMEIRPLIGRRIRIGRRLHVEPKVFSETLVPKGGGHFDPPPC